MEFLVTFFTFLLAFLGLASGLLLTGRRLSGSCGGVATGSACACKKAGRTPPPDCQRAEEMMETTEIVQISTKKPEREALRGAP